MHSAILYQVAQNKETRNMKVKIDWEARQNKINLDDIKYQIDLVTMANHQRCACLGPM